MGDGETRSQLRELVHRFATISMASQVRLIQDFHEAAAELAPGRSLVVSRDDGEVIAFGEDGRFTAQVLDEAGIWRTLATPQELADFYDPSDLFMDLETALEAGVDSSSFHLSDQDSLGGAADDEDDWGLPVLVRNYPGRTQADAARIFAQDTPNMAAHGYAPVSQSWAEGRPGIGRIVAIGIFALAIKPKGYLTVTYQLNLRTEPPKDRQVPAGSLTPHTADDVHDRLQALARLRDDGLVTPEEFEAKRLELIGRL